MTRHRLADLEPAIPDDNAPVPPARQPTWWRVWRVRAIGAFCVGAAIALALLSSYQSWQQARSSAEQAAAVEDRLAVLEEDLEARTKQRDEERDAAAVRDAETRAQISEVICELLGQLPADDEQLDQLRNSLGCQQPGLDPAAPPTASSGPGGPAGPGTTGSTQAPASPPATSSTATSGPAAPTGLPPPAAGTSAPPGPAPSTSPATPAPEPDRGFLEDLVCDLPLTC